MGDQGTDVAALVNREVLDILLPMHLVVDATGTIRGAGRTMSKVLEAAPVGLSLFDLVEIVKPRGPDGMDKLRRGARRRMHLQSRGPTGVGLRAVAMPFGADGSVIISTSIASDYARVVETLGLKSGDFSPADGTIDLVFAIQLQGTVLADARQLAEKIGRAKDEAERRATTDDLTGLFNRRALVAEIEQRLEGMAADNRPFCVLQVDLDRFKQVNDTLGHEAGDAVLLHVSQVLRQVAGDGGFVSRIGGDEFVILLGPETSQTRVAAVATEIIERITLPIPYGEQLCRIGASVGITRPCSASQGAPDLLMEADLALYESKRDGRGRYHFFAPRMRSRMAELNRLSAEIAEALAKGQFEPFFQPQVRLADRCLIGCEVLARWRHPERGLLAPAQFLFAADQANLLHRLDRHLTEQAFRHAGEWVRSGATFPGMSLNVTATALVDPGFSDRMKWLCDGADIAPEQIGLEILESVILGSDEKGLVDRIHALGDAGFKVFLDDFGTDRASISNLRHLRLDKIKIDRSFVSGIDRDRELRVMTGAMIDLATRLGIGTIAEGVETEAEAETLIELGCDACQGYLVSRPLDAASTAKLLVRKGDVGLRSA